MTTIWAGSAKWQALGWSLPGRRTKSGSSTEQISCAFQHRVWKLQPDGGSTGLGTSPSNTIRLRSSRPTGSGTGTADVVPALAEGERRRDAQRKPQRSYHRLW